MASSGEGNVEIFGDPSMTTPDLAYVAFIAVVLLFDHLVLWRTFLRRSRTDPAGARQWIWSSWITMLWTLAAAGIALWLLEGRGWDSLRMVGPRGWRRWGALGLTLALLFTYARTVARVARLPGEKRIKLGKQFGKLAAMLPHTRAELGWFVALSLTAGFCEEFIFRGYLLVVFRPMLGLWGAAALSVLAFAVAHAYQGRRGVLSAGLVGAALTLIVLGLGSLYPAIALHAILDIGQGLVAWLVLRRGPGGGDNAARVAESG